MTHACNGPIQDQETNGCSKDEASTSYCAAGKTQCLWMGPPPFQAHESCSRTGPGKGCGSLSLQFCCLKSTAPDHVVPLKTSQGTLFLLPCSRTQLAPRKVRCSICRGCCVHAGCPSMLWGWHTAATVVQDEKQGTDSAGSSLALFLALPLVSCTGAACHDVAAQGGQWYSQGQEIPSRDLPQAAGALRKQLKVATG